MKFLRHRSPLTLDFNSEQSRLESVICCLSRLLCSWLSESPAVRAALVAVLRWISDTFKKIVRIEN